MPKAMIADGRSPYLTGKELKLNSTSSRSSVEIIFFYMISINQTKNTEELSKSLWKTSFELCYK